MVVMRKSLMGLFLIINRKVDLVEWDGFEPPTSRMFDHFTHNQFMRYSARGRSEPAELPHRLRSPSFPGLLLCCSSNVRLFAPTYFSSFEDPVRASCTLILIGRIAPIL